jgi:hypothetical protein
MIMHCLNRFCCYEILAQKSLKMELWLKSYNALKFQGYIAGLQGLDFKYILKLGVRSGFAKEFEGLGVRFIGL